MSELEQHVPEPTQRCMQCGAVGPPTVYARTDDGGAPLGLCSRCARDRASLRALIRALGAASGSFELIGRPPDC